jgi:hypothetical protein
MACFTIYIINIILYFETKARFVDQIVFVLDKVFVKISNLLADFGHFHHTFFKWIMGK